MTKFMLTTFLFSVLLYSGCDDNKPTVLPPEPRLEGWIALGLADKTINRLVIAGDWLYACAARDGLYRIKHPASPGDQWQFLGLGDLDVVPTASAGVTDIVANDDTLIVGVISGTETAGIFRSFDDARTWTPSDSGFVSLDGFSRSGIVIRLLRSPLNPDLLLAGCQGERLVYLSDDFGISWALKFRGFFQRFDAVGFHPTREREIWAGGSNGNLRVKVLYRSTDLGETWQSVLERPPDPLLDSDSVQDIAFDSSDENTLFACLEKIIIKTTDSGMNWFTVLDTLNPGNVLKNLSSHPIEPGKLIACATDSVYRTINDGDSWMAFSPGPENNSSMQNLTVDWARHILYISTYNSLRGVYEMYF